MTHKKYLSQYERQKGLNFRLTQRDFEILKAINRCRYMRTGQIHRLVFPENKSIQSTRRRLRLLFHNEFLGRTAPFLQAGQGEGEMVYYLDKIGAEFLSEQDETSFIYAKSGQIKHLFLNHALDLSEFRINLELALKDHPIVKLQEFIADFEIQPKTKKATGKEKYKLFCRINDQFSRTNYVVYPDALIIIQGKGKYEEYKKLYFLEVDRGTEGLKVIQNKIKGYYFYKQKGIFKQFGENFNNFRVLIQTNSLKRAKNIRQQIAKNENTGSVWLTVDNQVNEKTILSQKIWLNEDFELKSLLK